jgi:hypothetical protein
MLTTQVVCLLVPSATNVNSMKSPLVRDTLALCVLVAKALEQVIAPVSKAPSVPPAALSVLLPSLSVKHLIPVIVQVTPDRCSRRFADMCQQGWH